MRDPPGGVYAALVIDAFARRIVGWKVASAPNTALVLDALDQAIAARQPGHVLIHHSEQGVQYLAIRYSKRLADVEVQPSVGRSRQLIRQCLGGNGDRLVQGRGDRLTGTVA